MNPVTTAQPQVQFGASRKNLALLAAVPLVGAAIGYGLSTDRFQKTSAPQPTSTEQPSEATAEERRLSEFLSQLEKEEPTIVSRQQNQYGGFANLQWGGQAYILDFRRLYENGQPTDETLYALINEDRSPGALHCYWYFVEGRELVQLGISTQPGLSTRIPVTDPGIKAQAIGLIRATAQKVFANP